MITGEIKGQIDSIWNALWTGGISNLLDVIEQITYLLFLKRLDEGAEGNVEVKITQVLSLINEMERDGVIDRYAIGGAVAAAMYLEPVATTGYRHLCGLLTSGKSVSDLSAAAL